jgi:homoserine O-acetyltransferase/O-succinyltransferase
VKSKIFFFIIILSCFIYPQEQKFGHLGDFKLVNGKEILDCKVGYRTIGKLNNDSSNVILNPTWFGGVSMNLLGNASKIIDTTKYFVIAVDALGNGVSSSPSNSSAQKDSLFPELTIKDMVNSQYRLLTEVLGIRHLHGIIGGSMGGMQVFQWVVSYPDFIKKAVAYVGTPRLTPFDLMLWSAEIQAINQWEKNKGDKDQLAELISTIHNLLITTPENKNNQVTREGFAKYLSDIQNNFKKSFEPYNWRGQLFAMSTHDISVDGSLETAASRIKCDFLIIVGSQDLIVNPAPALEFAERFNFKKYIFENNCGHLAPGCEFESFSGMVGNFFEEKTLN